MLGNQSSRLDLRQTNEPDWKNLGKKLEEAENTESLVPVPSRSFFFFLEFLRQDFPILPNPTDESQEEYHKINNRSGWIPSLINLVPVDAVKKQDSSSSDVIPRGKPNPLLKSEQIQKEPRV